MPRVFKRQPESASQPSISPESPRIKVTSEPADDEVPQETSQPQRTRLFFLIEEYDDDEAGPAPELPTVVTATPELADAPPIIVTCLQDALSSIHTSDSVAQAPVSVPSPAGKPPAAPEGKSPPVVTPPVDQKQPSTRAPLRIRRSLAWPEENSASRRRDE